MVLHKEPYTNFHDMNEDYIASKLEKLDKSVESAKADAESAKADAESASASAGKYDDVINDLQVLDARMDEFTRLPDGSTTGDAELADIRVWYNGRTSNTAGDAVRGQISILNDELDDITEQVIGVNLFDGNFDEEGYINGGADAPSSAFKRTSNYYQIIGERDGNLYCRSSVAVDPMAIVFYDADKNFIKNDNFNNTTTKIITLPTNAEFFRMYTRTNYSGYVTISLSYQTGYIPYEIVTKIKDDSIQFNMLSQDVRSKISGSLLGKTIAFMGDSIIGNFYDSTGICSIIAENTGANVINCAFGGTRMAYVYSRYGDATPTATGYVDGATDAEKNQVNQYRYWNSLSGVGLADAIASGIWTLQNNAVANMSSGLAYFTERLAQVKAIDWSNVDFIMWEYGTNDFMTKVALTGSDLFAYDYAYRHVIETILTAYPNIRIITATPTYRWYQSGGSFIDDSNTHIENDYTGTSHKLTDFVEMAQNVSKNYQLPCIDDYYTLGANRFTRLAFFNSTDGTHPNEQGRKRIAEHIASQLVTIV